MNNYPVHVELILVAEAPDNESAELDALMEALAELDEANPSVLDWTVGFDGDRDVLDIDLTVLAEHHADALAYGHSLVRSAAAEVAGRLSKETPFLDSDAEIKVFS